jgi:DNA-binding transcriptional MerR regulator
MLKLMARIGIQIGKVSEQTGLSIRRHPLLREATVTRPTANRGGFRLFNTRDVERIQFIQRAQQLGFSLTEVRELLVLRRDDGEACSHVRDLLRAKVAAVRHKIAELGVLEEQSTKSLRKCERQLKVSGDSHKGAAR